MPRFNYGVGSSTNGASRGVDYTGRPEYLGNGLYNTGLDYQSSTDPMIDAYYKANPFVGQTYNKSWFERVFGGIFRTGYDKWLQEMQLNASQWDASVVDMEQQLAYNSETAKADRMRQSGENPDLLGTGDVSDSPGLAPDVQDAQIPDAVDTGQLLNFATQIGSAVVGLVPGVMSFMTNLASLRNLRLENDASELQFGMSAVDMATKFFGEGITKSDYEDAFKSGDFTNILEASKKDSNYLTDTFLSSPQARKRFQLAYGMHANSLIADMQKYKTYDEYEKARGGILGVRSSSRFSDNDETQMELMKAVLTPYENWEKKIYEINERIANLRNPDLEQGLLNKEMSNDLSYENSIDRSLEAQTENAGYDYQKQLYEIQKATDDMFSEIMKNLTEADKWYSPIAKALVGIARAQLLSGFHMQFGVRSSRYQNPKNGASAESSAYNFGF